MPWAADGDVSANYMLSTHDYHNLASMQRDDKLHTLQHKDMAGVVISYFHMLPGDELATALVLVFTNS
jgi:hypothetical protein